MERLHEDNDQPEGPSDRASGARTLDVHVGYDPITKNYYIDSSDIPGLHAEAPDFEALCDITRDAAPDLLGSDLNRTRIRISRTIDFTPINGW